MNMNIEIFHIIIYELNNKNYELSNNINNYNNI